MTKLLRRPTRTLLVPLILIGVLVSSFCSSCSGQKSQGPEETIKIGATPIELNLLLYAAEERGFLKENGVRLEMKDYDTGAAAIGGLTKGEVDIGLTFESVIVSNIFQKQDVIDLATINKSILFYIIIRNDRGINTIADLRGKRIGIPRQTIMEFFLGRTLEINGMNINQVTLENITPSASETAIAAGDYDAIVAFEPHVSRIKNNLGSTVTIRSIQGSQASYWSIVSTSGWINQNFDLAKRFFKALAQAEEFVNLHDAEARTILKDRLKYDESYVADLWSQNQFGLSLDQSLITAMEDEARWMISNNLTPEKNVPNFNNYIYEGVLKSVKPEAVDIIR